MYNIYFHALANFPGSKLWTCTRFTYLLSLWSGRLARDVRDLHGRYGDVVRIAPNELSFARPDAWHDVYSNRAGQPAFPKSKLWHGVAPGRPMSVLNALEPRSHARFRKAMDPAFTERAVRAQEPIIQNYVGSLILNLRKTVAEGSGVVDIVRWYAFVAFDLVGDLGFGESFDCLQHTEFHPWVSMIFNSLRAATYRASLRYYPSLDWLLKFAIPRSVMQKQMEHWKLAVDKINRRLDLPLESGRPDLISLIKRDDAGVDGLTLPEMQATASVIIVAGSETTVSVLSGTTNYLVKNPSKLGILTREIRDKFRKEEDITLTALKDKAPYLNAVIQEGFRLCNPT